MSPFAIVLALRHLRLSTVAALRSDAKAGALSEATQSAITADLEGVSATPPNIQAIIADLPGILALIAEILPLFGG